MGHRRRHRRRRERCTVATLVATTLPSIVVALVEPSTGTSVSFSVRAVGPIPSLRPVCPPPPGVASPCMCMYMNTFPLWWQANGATCSATGTGTISAAASLHLEPVQRRADRHSHPGAYQPP
eukprot:scaffold77916_cov51-Phaeocystis_antarctica.AAC.1